jgi:MraZ protein
VKHAVLIGEFELTIDDKNRLLIPAEVRRTLDPQRDGEAFILVIGVNKRPWLYPENYYQQLVSAAEQSITPEEDSLAFDLMHFAMASRLEWDKQGRVLIPDKTLRRTGIGKEVTLVGVRNHLELWNRDDWEAHHEALMERMSEISLRAKQSQRVEPGK